MMNCQQTLMEDTIKLMDLPLSKLLLMNDSQYPVSPYTELAVDRLTTPLMPALQTIQYKNRQSQP